MGGIKTVVKQNLNILMQMFWNSAVSIVRSLSVLKDLQAGESSETGKLTTRDKTGSFPKAETQKQTAELEF